MKTKNKIKKAKEFEVTNLMYDDEKVFKSVGLMSDNLKGFKGIEDNFVKNKVVRKLTDLHIKNYFRNKFNDLITFLFKPYNYFKELTNRFVRPLFKSPSLVTYGSFEEFCSTNNQLFFSKIMQSEDDIFDRSITLTPEELDFAKKVVEYALDQLQMRRDFLGYSYLFEAILYVIEKPQAIYRLMGDVYEKIAKEHNSTAKNVSGVLRRVVEDSYLSGAHVAINHMLKTDIYLDMDKPTTGEIIGYVAYYYDLKFYNFDPKFQEFLAERAAR